MVRECYNPLHVLVSCLQVSAHTDTTQLETVKGRVLLISDAKTHCLCFFVGFSVGAVEDGENSWRAHEPVNAGCLRPVSRPQELQLLPRVTAPAEAVPRQPWEAFFLPAVGPRATGGPLPQEQLPRPVSTSSSWT